MDDTNVVMPEMDAVEATTETPSTSAEETNLQELESTDSPVSEDVQTQEQTDSIPEEARTEKAKNRFQELANENKLLREQLESKQASSPQQQQLQANEQWLKQYEQNPFIPERGAFAQQLPDYQIAAQRAEIENLKIQNQLNQQATAFEKKYNSAMEIANNNPLLTKGNPEYSEDYRAMYEELVFEDGKEPKVALEKITKLYKSALSKAQTANEIDNLQKKTMNISGTTPKASEPDIDKMSVAEYTAYLEKKGIKRVGANG